MGPCCVVVLCDNAGYSRSWIDIGICSATVDFWAVRLGSRSAFDFLFFFLERVDVMWYTVD